MEQVLALPWTQALCTMLTDIQGKLGSHPAVFDHSHHLTQIFRRFSSGEILWPLLIRVTPRAAACITFGSCFKPKNGLGRFLQTLVLLLGTVNCRELPGLSYCWGCHVKGESFQTKGLQNRSPSKFVARNQNHTAVFRLDFPRFSWELCKYFKHQTRTLNCAAFQSVVKTLMHFVFPNSSLP